VGKYTTIFWDLDRTIWDFNKNSHETLKELFEVHQLEARGIKSFEKFYRRYLKVNNYLWYLYNHNKINKVDLRSVRFRDTLKAFDIEDEELALTLSDEYITQCPKKGVLVDGALEIIQGCQTKGYKQVILTNGFEETQKVKMKHADLNQYFDMMISSELVDCQKPYAPIFDYALEHMNVKAEEVVMIGDSWESDIVGAKNMDIDQIYYNPGKENMSFEPTHNIQHLSALKEILL